MCLCKLEEHFGSEQLCLPRLAADDLKPVLSAALCHLENSESSVLSCCSYLAVGCVAQLWFSHPEESVCALFNLLVKETCVQNSYLLTRENWVLNFSLVFAFFLDFLGKRNCPQINCKMSFVLRGCMGITLFTLQTPWIHLDVHIGFITAIVGVTSKMV